MVVAIEVLGLFPGAAYLAAMISGLGFGIKRPAEYLVVTLLAPAWSELVFYALVLGGCVLSAILGLGTSDQKQDRGSCTRILGGIAVLLLLVNTPMSIFQFHRLLAHEM